jgi:hypothetical protein
MQVARKGETKRGPEKMWVELKEKRKVRLETEVEKLSQ